MPIQRLMSDEALLQELGRRIARLRLERNLSQAQLAEQAGISKRTLEGLEAGAAATQLSLFLRVLWGCPGSMDRHPAVVVTCFCWIGLWVHAVPWQEGLPLAVGRPRSPSGPDRAQRLCAFR